MINKYPKNKKDTQRNFSFKIEKLVETRDRPEEVTVFFLPTPETEILLNILESSFIIRKN